MGLKERREPSKAPWTENKKLGVIFMKIKEFFGDFYINPISASPYHGPITDELIDHIK